MITPNVADMAHFNSVNFTEIAFGGIWSVIHKATQGLGIKDQMYARRMAAAKEAGFLWGAYDFATHDDPIANAKTFLAFANLGPNDAAVLDFEDNSASEMTGDQAYAWLDTVAQALGRAPMIYGGNRPREQIDHQQAKWIDMAKSVRLWQCRYIGGQPADNAALFAAIPPIAPWTENFLIQYTGDGVGPQPHTVTGLENGADLNVFNGTKDQLTAAWAGTTPGATA